MVVFIIIGITVLFSYKGFQDQNFFYKFSFDPYQVKHNKSYERFLTHGLLHGDWAHLFFNMFVLYMFGTSALRNFNVNAGDLGTFYFILLYVAGIAFASLSTYKKHQDNPNYHSIGASGAVSAVLFSYILFQPLTELRLLIFPFFGLPSVIWGIAYLAYEHYQSRKSTNNINHDAHLWGAIFGIVFTLITVPESGKLFILQIQYALGFIN